MGRTTKQHHSLGTTNKGGSDITTPNQQATNAPEINANEPQSVNAQKIVMSTKEPGTPPPNFITQEEEDTVTALD